MIIGFNLSPLTPISCSTTFALVNDYVQYEHYVVQSIQICANKVFGRAKDLEDFMGYMTEAFSHLTYHIL